MPFKKGDVNINRAGRPKGAANKSPVDLRESITHFLSGNFKKIEADINKLKPIDRVRYYIALLPYSLPKLQTIEMNTFSNLEKLSDDQLDKIINQIIEIVNKKQSSL